MVAGEDGQKVLIKQSHSLLSYIWYNLILRPSPKVI